MISRNNVARPFSPGVKQAAYAFSILAFFGVDDFSPWADKVLLFALGAGTLLSVLQQRRLKKADAALMSITVVYFVLAIVLAFLFAEYFGLHSFTGLYELWRAHISLVLGLILAGCFATTRKDEIFHGLMLALKVNVAFSLLQAVSGGYLVEAMLTFSQFGDEPEYRSGIVRTVGFFTNPNANAWFIALYLYYLMSQGKASRLWVALSVAALFTTSSRTVLFASLVIIAVQLAKSHNVSLAGFFRKYSLHIVVAAGAVLLLDSFSDKSSSLGYSLVPDVEVITTVEEGKIEDSYFRAYALKTCTERFLESPVVGLGPGNYGTPSSFRSHSKYLSEDGFDFFIERGMTQLDMLIPLLLPETGLIGFAMWAILMALMLRELKRREPGASRAQAVYYWCLLLIVNSFVGPGITHPLIVAMLPLVVACAVRANERATADGREPGRC